jgi:hypothetical protein
MDELGSTSSASDAWRRRWRCTTSFVVWDCEPSLPTSCLPYSTGREDAGSASQVFECPVRFGFIPSPPEEEVPAISTGPVLCPLNDYCSRRWLTLSHIACAPCRAREWTVAAASGDSSLPLHRFVRISMVSAKFCLARFKMPSFM